MKTSAKLAKAEADLEAAERLTENLTQERDAARKNLAEQGRRFRDATIRISDLEQILESRGIKERA